MLTDDELGRFTAAFSHACAAASDERWDQESVNLAIALYMDYHGELFHKLLAAHGIEDVSRPWDDHLHLRGANGGFGTFRRGDGTPFTWYPIVRSVKEFRDDMLAVLKPLGFTAPSPVAAPSVVSAGSPPPSAPAGPSPAGA